VILSGTVAGLQGAQTRRKRQLPLFLISSVRTGNSRSTA
jgi:hypothetical protein